VGGRRWTARWKGMVGDFGERIGLQRRDIYRENPRRTWPRAYTGMFEKNFVGFKEGGNVNRPTPENC